MADETPEERAAQLANSGRTSKARLGSGASIEQKAGILTAVAAICVGLLGYIWWPDREPSGLKSSESTSFINGEGDAFGNIKRPVPVKPPDPNPELLEKIRSLEGMIADLKNRPVQSVRDDVEINELTLALKDLKNQTEKASEEYKQSIRDRDLDIQRLKNELDARRLASGENVNSPDAEKLAAEALLRKRVNSPLSPLSGTNSNSTDRGAEKSVLEQKTLSQNALFARDQAKPVPVEQARIVANPSNTVLQGTVLQASLETAINTDLPGAIRAVVAEDVHSLDGTRVLIPRGAKVIGKYSDTISLGQKRVMVIWERILLPDNQTVTINSYGGDAIGQTGVKGVVDSHFFERFGSAALISVIGVAPTLATAALTGHNNSKGTGSITTINTVADPMSQNLQSALSGVIGDYLRRPPTIGVHQGANITIFVDRDLEIF
ncbi:TrbI/VirB10 family protein [Brucella pseudogrignonensis]